MPGVYLSYPFCHQKCSFCNFSSGVYSPANKESYSAVLRHELGGHKWAWHPETVYLGGGTPSLMPAELLTDLMAMIPADCLMESTIECAPGTITPDKLNAWIRLGINRVSVGVQSFNETELRHTGRHHSAETVMVDVRLLREHGISNINLDLIAGLPYQTRGSWQQSLDWIERLDVPHASVYLFEIDEDSRLGQEVLLGGKRYSAGFLPNDDLAADLYCTAVARLAEMGLARYEISNFAAPGRESRHNLKYWTREPYVGFGLDAHSFDGDRRWSNSDDLEAYLRGGVAPEYDRVNTIEERFFVGLRLSAGIRPTREERRRFAEPIEKWTAFGLLEQNGETLRLSDAGVLVSSEILQDFIQEPTHV